MSGFHKFELTPLEAPCRNCNKRHIGCHSECKAYIDYNKDNEAIRAKKLKRIMEGDAFYFNKLNRFSDLRKNGVKLRHGKRAK